MPLYKWIQKHKVNYFTKISVQEIFIDFLKILRPPLGMFIISNNKKDSSFEVSKTNNLYVIKNNDEEIIHEAIEENSPVGYFTIKMDTQQTAFLTEEFEPAKFFTIETKYEQPKKDVYVDNTTLYHNLINDFGDKKSKEILSKRGMVSYINKENITFNVENQILPNYNKDATSIKDCYSLNYMFPEQIIQEFIDCDIPVEDLSDFIRPMYNEDYRVYYLVLDCIYKTLDSKLVLESNLSYYRFFYDSIKGFLSNRRISLLEKDKLAAKFYIILLMVSGYTSKLELLPRFGTTATKLNILLKMIGCTVSKSGLVKLEILPKDTYTTKKQKK